MINRCAVIVRPAQPYMDWAASVDDGNAPDLNGEPSVYLIPAYYDDVEGWEMLSECFDMIFEAELYGWHTREAEWPRNRTFAMFRDWFDISFSAYIEDLCEGPIVDDRHDTFDA